MTCLEGFSREQVLPREMLSSQLPCLSFIDSSLWQWIWSDLSLATREVDHGKTCAEHVEKHRDVAVVAIGK